MHALVALFHSLTVREWVVAGGDILIVYYVIYRTLLLINESGCRERCEDDAAVQKRRCTYGEFR